MTDSTRQHNVELEGGPHHGRRLRATAHAVAVLFHDVMPPGSMAAYQRTERLSAAGCTVFVWTGTAPPDRNGPLANLA
jgi:hypothetical protein